MRSAKSTEEQVSDLQEQLADVGEQLKTMKAMLQSVPGVAKIAVDIGIPDTKMQSLTQAEHRQVASIQDGNISKEVPKTSKKKKRKTKKRPGGGKVLAVDRDGNEQWAIHKYHGRRVDEEGHVEYLFEWTDYNGPPSWEPRKNATKHAKRHMEEHEMTKACEQCENGLYDHVCWLAYCGRRVDRDGHVEYLVDCTRDDDSPTWELRENANTVARKQMEEHEMTKACEKCKNGLFDHECWADPDSPDLSQNIYTEAEKSEESGDNVNADISHAQVACFEPASDGDESHYSVDSDHSTSSLSEGSDCEDDYWESEPNISAERKKKRRGTRAPGKKARNSNSKRKSPKRQKLTQWDQRLDKPEARNWVAPTTTSPYFANLRIIEMRCTFEEDNQPKNLAELIFKDRIRLLVVSLKETKRGMPFQSVLRESGDTYELISAKIHKDDGIGSTQFFGPKQLDMCYVKINGMGQSLQDWLDRMGNFSVLEPRKQKARLELLQSPAHKVKGNKPAITWHETRCFATFEEKNEEKQGCGFVSEEMMDAILGSFDPSERATAVQCRVVVPSQGWFKGMLVCKPGLRGKQILLPASMKKVPASTRADAHDGGYVLVCQGGVYPNRKTHVHIGQLLKKEKTRPPQSFQPKAPSDMVIRLWEGLGVRSAVCHEYVRRSKDVTYLKHAWVGGVADFSGKLPAGHIFVPGLQGLTIDKLYVSRSPCLEPTDGRMLPLVKTKPTDLSQSDWEWLLTLPFGVIFFADPPGNMMSIPEQVAEGDLDGDRYFVCWDEEILGEIKYHTQIELNIPSKVKSAPDGPPQSDPDWLRKAQERMLAQVEHSRVQQLVGKLYRLSVEQSTKSKESIRCRDAVAFARAYKMALDFGKHGGSIYLPEHLHEQVPTALQQYLSSEK